MSVPKIPKFYKVGFLEATPWGVSLYMYTYTSSDFAFHIASFLFKPPLDDFLSFINLSRSHQFVVLSPFFFLV